MHVLHTFWLPDPSGTFRRGGGLHLWIETEEASGEPGQHPCHLPAGPLRARLGELQLPVDNAAIGPVSLTLPTLEGRPLACPELPTPESSDAVTPTLQDWTVAAWRMSTSPIASLNELHFQSLLSGGTLRAGSDFLFWYWFTQSLKAVLFKDAYIPSLRLRQRDAAPPSIESGWEFAGEPYDELIRRGVDCMPPAAAPGFAPESLLRHCAEVLLHQAIGQSQPPQALLKRLGGTLLAACLGSAAEPGGPADTAEQDYQAWRRWRDQLSGASRGGAAELCFQVQEASATDPDRWWLEFRAVARGDASFQLPLADYWSAVEAEREALVKPLGADFERAMLLKLGQAARMYPALWSALETAEPVGLALTLEDAFEFLHETAWVLQDAGFRVNVPAWWTPRGRQRAKLRLRQSGPRKSVAAAGKRSVLGLKELLSYRYELTLAGEAVDVAEWEQLLEAKIPLVRFRGQWVALDRERMREMLDFWRGRGGEAQDLSPIDLLQQTAADDGLFEVDHDDALAGMLAKLRDVGQLQPVDDPPALNARLRDYQKRGVAWLNLLENLGLCGCLADDMGLGKTIQVIARLVVERQGAVEPIAPTLLVAPTSVLGNWRNEIGRFASSLRVHVHHGGGRSSDAVAFAAACADADVVITSYSLVRRDAALFGERVWGRLVLDEAQNIKNPVAEQTKSILRLKAERRLALTGTPVENRLLDLWSIFNFLNPGYLGKQAQFRKVYELPIQRENDAAKSALLKRLIEPFILRRVKTDPNIIKDLPDKVENRQCCELSREQASLYEAVVLDVTRQLDESEGIQRQGLMLSTLMKLKQICNHPAQFLQDESPFTPDRSQKLERLLAMLGEVVAEGESALVFTQFTDIGQHLERLVRTELDCQTYYLHGGTARGRREQMIERFQNPETPPGIFVLSLKAGGVGITLTRANHVFHFDRWWNPAVEDQATDRAFRIGQKRNVFVHKFITLGTLEERIDKMIEEKRAVAGSIVGNDESWLAKLDNQSFRQLIALNRQTLGG